MGSIQASVVTEINEQHQLAVQHAGRAIEHAKRAGELLTQVKASLPHGAFLAWMAAHVDVSPRQAQRYMAAAQGRALPVRGIKGDMVSHLPKRQAAFEPIPDCWMFTEEGGCYFVIEQSTSDGHFFCSMLQANVDDVVLHYLTRPIRGDFVEVPLRDMGLADPAAAAWHIGRGCRVASALGVQL